MSVATVKRLLALEALPWEEVFQQIGVACTEHKGCISPMLLINRSDRNDWSAAEGHTIHPVWNTWKVKPLYFLSSQDWGLYDIHHKDIHHTRQSPILHMVWWMSADLVFCWVFFGPPRCSSMLFFLGGTGWSLTWLASLVSFYAISQFD